MASGGLGGLLGDWVTGELGGFPKKPTVPPFTPITPEEAQRRAAAANLQELPELEKLVGKANLFSREQINQMLAAAGIDIGKEGQGIIDIAGREMKGELPLGDVSQVWNRAVASSFGAGTGGAGSGAGRNLVARDLGLAELGVIQQGINTAEQWTRLSDALYAPSMLNVGSMFLTEPQEFQQTLVGQEAQWNVNWLQDQIAALPDPEDAAIARDVGSIAGGAADTGVGLLQSYAGWQLGGGQAGTGQGYWNYANQQAGGGGGGGGL